MKTAILVTPLTKEIPTMEEAIYVGVDAGALHILDKGLPLAFAVGDFDSMDRDAYVSMKKETKVYKHPVMKNETDSELAIRLCVEQGYERIFLTGSMTGRLDHTVANLRLLMYTYPQVILWDETQCAYCLDVGVHTISNTYTHVSFFAVDQACISLEGFLYTLHEENIQASQIYTVSNSIVKDEGRVTVHQGRVLCIQSNLK